MFWGWDNFFEHVYMEYTLRHLQRSTRIQYNLYAVVWHLMYLANKPSIKCSDTIKIVDTPYTFGPTFVVRYSLKDGSVQACWKPFFAESHSSASKTDSEHKTRQCGLVLISGSVLFEIQWLHQVLVKWPKKKSSWVKAHQGQNFCCHGDISRRCGDTLQLPRHASQLNDNSCNTWD